MFHDRLFGTIGLVVRACACESPAGRRCHDSIRSPSRRVFLGTKKPVVEKTSRRRAPADTCGLARGIPKMARGRHWPAVYGRPFNLAARLAQKQGTFLGIGAAVSPRRCMLAPQCTSPWGQGGSVRFRYLSAPDVSAPPVRYSFNTLISDAQALAASAGAVYLKLPKRFSNRRELLF